MEPHHFQQWDRYHSAQLHARIRSLNVYPWGFMHLQVDVDRLTNGEFSLVECGGVMPDGLVFELSGGLGNIPETRNIKDYDDFSPNNQILGVYLGIPSLRREGGNTQLQDHQQLRSARYIAGSAPVRDDNTGVDEQWIEMGRMNFKVILEGESFQGYTLLKLAEIERTGVAGQFRLRESFVPACLYIGASPYLMKLTRRIVENLVTHRAKMSARVRGIFSQRETTPQDVLILGKLAAINANIPIVKHYFEQKASHPEFLYIALSSLAGQLYTYVSSARVDPDNYPSYTHESLSNTFNTLEELLIELLSDIDPDPIYASIEWTDTRNNIYTARIPDEYLDRRFFLKVSSSHIPVQRLLTDLPTTAKIGSPNSIQRIVTHAVNGVALRYTRKMPSSVPTPHGANYFELTKDGENWNEIVKERGISLFVPYTRNQVDIELMAIE